MAKDVILSTYKFKVQIILASNFKIIQRLKNKELKKAFREIYQEDPNNYIQLAKENQYNQELQELQNLREELQRKKYLKQLKDNPEGQNSRKNTNILQKSSLFKTQKNIQEDQLDEGPVPRQRMRKIMGQFKKVAFFIVIFKKSMQFYIKNKRDKQMKALYNEIPKALVDSIEYIKSSCERGFKLLVHDKKLNIDLELDLKQGKDVNKIRTEQLKNIVKIFIDCLIDGLSDSSISKDLILFFAKLYKQFSFPPANYLTKFELDRIQFTCYGQYQTQNKAVMQMIILHFFIIRILLQEVLNKPWIVLSGVQETLPLKQNCFYVGAVIQQLLLEYLKSTTATYNESQLNVLREFKNIQKQGFMKAKADAVIDREDQQDFQKYGEPLILGFPSELKMGVIFNNQQWNQERKYTLQGFGEKLVEMSTKVQNNIPDFKFNLFEQINQYLKSKNL